MEKPKLEELYREYLLGFMKHSFDGMIETDVLSFEEFQEQLNEKQIQFL